MLTFTRSSDVYTQLCGIAGLVLPLSSPKRVFGNGICFNYVSLVFSQDVMASMAPMQWEDITTDPTRSVYAFGFSR